MNTDQQARDTAHAKLIAETDETAGLRGEVERLREALTECVLRDRTHCHSGCLYASVGPIKRGSYTIRGMRCAVLDGQIDKLCPIVEALRDGE